VERYPTAVLSRGDRLFLSQDSAFSGLDKARMPYITSVEEIGFERGCKEEARSLILRQLTRRVGSLPTNLTSRVEALPLEQLESLGEALLDFSAIADLGIEPTLQLEGDNEPQPDAMLLLPSEAGGRSRFTEDDYVEGAPELIIEVAASSASIDLHQKKTVYCRNGVQEYIVWQIFENQLHWFVLQQGEYVDLEPNADGIIQSQVFPGLWLSITDLLKGNMTSVLTVLQQGLASPEHTEFVESLTVALE
jgi:Putative restriction endonuclease/Domain of unknown function (DUF4351)